MSVAESERSEMSTGDTSEITFARGPLRFRAVVAGPDDGEPVVLLHGFPQRVSSWDAVAPLLHEAGCRTIALDQRGYCATARPRGRRAYRLSELVGDVLALLDTLAAEGGSGTAHVVGHDWGAVVAWALAAAHPERVRTLVPVSVPPPAAFLRSMVTSDQLGRSWYWVSSSCRSCRSGCSPRVARVSTGSSAVA